MFSFINSKPVLKDLIPSNYVDIHSHLLPGIDDGAKTIDDTEFLITELQKIGFSKFITTPHTFNGVWDNTMTGINSKKEETIALLNQKNIDVNLKSASEYLLNEHLIELIEKQEILTLKENYVLVEMSYLNPPIQLYDFLFNLQVAGYIPVLAHPERYSFYHKSLYEFIKLKKQGCLFQLNLLSSVGYYGKDVANVANYLLANDFIDYVGSDVHHKQHLKSLDSKIIIRETKKLEKVIDNNQFFNF